MEQAIKKAIEGGWKEPRTALAYGCDAMEQVWKVEDRDPLFTVEDIYLIPEVLLDPLFWQALGKAEGWSKRVCRGCGSTEKPIEGDYHLICPKCNRGGENRIDNWLYHWHSFIDHLAEGKDIDSFFKDLLAQ